MILLASVQWAVVLSKFTEMPPPPIQYRFDINSSGGILLDFYRGTSAKYLQ